MKLTESDKQRIKGYLMESKSAAMRALSCSDPHSRRLARKLERICAELEAAQVTASALRVSVSENV